ncbi:MAG: PQQ-dependent sugar dehydrogenase, partial [Gammaproteobacteria bacterium]
FASDDDPDTYGEIYAHGFRNAHRLSWDMADGTMYAADIGMSQVEEINIVREGGNYGWMQREGIFDNGVSIPGGELGDVFPLPAAILDGRTEDNFTYPVAMYDHGEGRAITAGFAYRGSIPALRGKLVFGELVRGRLFAADLAAITEADDGIPQTVAPIEEIQLYVRDESGDSRNVTLQGLVEEALGTTITRVDLQVSQGRDGEIFVTSRQDGIIRMLVADSGNSGAPASQ